MEREGSFQAYQTARDAGLVLLGLGYTSLAGSIAYLVLGWSYAGLFGWFYFLIGPVTLMVSLVAIPLGSFLWRKSKRIRPN